MLTDRMTMKVERALNGHLDQKARTTICSSRRTDCKAHKTLRDKTKVLWQANITDTFTHLTWSLEKIISGLDHLP